MARQWVDWPTVDAVAAELERRQERMHREYADAYLEITFAERDRDAADDAWYVNLDGPYSWAGSVASVRLRADDSPETVWAHAEQLLRECRKQWALRMEAV